MEQWTPTHWKTGITSSVPTFSCTIASIHVIHSIHLLLATVIAWHTLHPLQSPKLPVSHTTPSFFTAVWGWVKRIYCTRLDTRVCRPDWQYSTFHLNNSLMKLSMLFVIAQLRNFEPSIAL